MQHLCPILVIVTPMALLSGCERAATNEEQSNAPAASQPAVSTRSEDDRDSREGEGGHGAQAGRPVGTAYVEPPERPSIRAQGEFHSKPIVERDGRLLLWASGSPGSGEQQWFDMTGSLIDPAKFQYGIGKDTIPSIDEPVFVPYGDPVLAQHGIGDLTQVIGFEHNGIARAYPVRLLNRHEIVNDEFAGEPFAVCW